jgi:two-component system, sensor histidine kinase YesM
MVIGRFRKLLHILLHRLIYNLTHFRLYSRLMICYTLIFLLVAYVFAFAATRYYIQYTTVKQLEQSRNALNAVCNYYEIKQTELSDIILPFYQTYKSDFYLDSMFRSPTDEEYYDPLKKMRIFEVLQEIAERDGDIEEILLYKDINESRFVYKRKSKMFEIVGQDYPFFNIMADWKFGRITTGTQMTGGNSSVKNKNVYGIGGVLGLDNETSVKGKFLIAFNTEAIKSVYQGYSGNYGRFILASITGDVIFDSDGDYNGEKLPYINMLLAGKDSASIDGQQCYIQTIVGQKASYIGVNTVPKKALGDSNIPLLIYGTFTLMAIICVALYMTGGHFISRRVKEIGLAMKRVGSNNLSYRIPILKQSDEFGEIAVKFNEMCNELQKTIDLEYISEIKKKNAELESLQAGINPHFLYNTLEVIRVKAVDAGNDDVAGMIVDLANLYRAMVKNGTFIPIRNEINICDIYIDIFSYHYENSLDYETDIDPQVMKFGIPKNLLHPIIENYFVHGIKNKANDNRFSIHGFLTNEDICFVFEDNGRGIDKNQLDEIRSSMEAAKLKVEAGYGLLNVQQRIRLIYGEPYGITLESEENNVTRITVLIKAMTCEELEASLKSPQKH